MLIVKITTAKTFIELYSQCVKCHMCVIWFNSHNTLWDRNDNFIEKENEAQKG